MTPEKPQIYLVPRWAGNIHSDWYDGVFELIQKKHDIDIVRLEMPDWNEPNKEKSIEFLSNHVQQLNSQSYFIGHSVGCQAIIHFLSKNFKQISDLQIGGLLFIASWFEVDNPWISLKPWLKTDNINFELISKGVKFKKVILSDNDPFTTDYLKNKSLWEKNIQAEVIIEHNRLHFNEKHEPLVFSEIEKMIENTKKIN